MDKFVTTKFGTMQELKGPCCTTSFSSMLLVGTIGHRERVELFAVDQSTNDQREAVEQHMKCSHGIHRRSCALAQDRGELIKQQKRKV